MCLLVVVLPHDPALKPSGVAMIGVAAAILAAAMLSLRRAPAYLFDGGLLVGSLLIALLIASGGGADIALAFAGSLAWVMVLAAMFRTPRAAVGHAALAVAAASAAWQPSGRPWPDFGFVIVTSGAVAVVVGQLVRQVRRSAATDRTTGFLNGHGLAAAGQRMLDTALPGEHVAVLVLQIRGWQELIRSLGYDAADAVLSRVAATLSAGPGRRFVEARLSGDRLVALLAPATLTGGPAAEVAIGTARRGLDLIRGPHEVAGVSLQLEGHIGVALSGTVEGGLEELLRAGEAALAEGVAADVPVTVFDPGAARVGAEQLRLLADLRAGILAGELRVHYQVQVGAHTGRTTAVEALVRWQHPTRGLLPPGAFLPLAEPTDIIVDLTWAVLDDALRQCAAWLGQGLEVPVSVNLSARLLAFDDLVDKVLSLLAAHDVPSRLLVLEVTETALVSRPQRAAAMLGALREQGVQTSLDDFGTGTTSLTLLAGVAFDEIKVDRSFVSAGLTDPRAASIVRSIVELGHSLGLEVVAEGVEDAATAAWLAELGCDQLQGFHFGRPQPAAELTGLPDVASPPASAQVPQPRTVAAGVEDALQNQRETASDRPASLPSPTQAT